MEVGQMHQPKMLENFVAMRRFIYDRCSLRATAVYSCFVMSPALPTPLKPIRSLDRSVEDHVPHQCSSPIYNAGYPLPCVAF
jgi:hypothetical protein